MTAAKLRSRTLWLRRTLVGGGLFVVLASSVALALASERIVAEQAAYRLPSAGRCEASQLNRSALLPGTSVAVSPLPGSYDASPRTQISMLGVPGGGLSGVRVSGSSSGSHSGRLAAYSQGDGASFLPSRPFQPGETVTVRGRVRVGARAASFAYHFVVAQPDTTLYSAPVTPVAKSPDQVQHFHSRTELEAPTVLVSARSPQAAGGDVFAAPYSGPGPAGPMIFDEAGNLVWFDPLHGVLAASNLQVQQEGSTPVLTWWQGRITTQGFGVGEEIIDNSSYHQIGRVLAGNGFSADLHEFHLTTQGTALLTVFSPIDCNLSSLGGPAGGAVTDTIFQEVDMASGLVRREWHSLDHVALADSYSSVTTASHEWPFDYFHLNTVDQLANGRTLISARNTWGIYELNTQTGQVLTRIGGRHSDLKAGAGASTAFQHDAMVLPDGDISIFDNGAVPKVHPQSRGLILALDPKTRTDSMVTEYEHPSALSSDSQGNMQTLANGDVFIGWGSQPYFSEFSASDHLLFDAHMHGTYQSYRAYRFAWTGEPSEPPSIAASATGAGVSVYASWNGDTRTASWRVLGGASPSTLTPVAEAPRSGFETALTTPAPEAYVEVQALSAAGTVIGSSRTVAG